MIDHSQKQIAIVVYALHIGGMETAVFAIARGLRDAGFCITLVVTDKIGAWHGRAQADGFELIAVLPRPWESALSHARRVGQLLMLYDGVLLNFSRPGQAAAGLLSSHAAVISVLHNDHPAIYTVGLEGINNGDVDFSVCVSPRVYAEALSRGSPAERTLLIPYGIPVAAAWPKQHDTSNGQPSDGRSRPLRTLYVGRIEHSHKGVLDLPGIMRRVEEAGYRVMLRVVGDGPDREALKAALSKCGPGVNVIWHGPVPHGRAIDLMRQSDVLVMPSRYEGLPLVLLEAMAEGVVPVVSTLSGITDEVIAAGKSGFCASVGDEAGFADALCESMDPARRMHMSESAWRTAYDRFSEKRMVAEYAGLFDEVIRCRSGRSTRPRTGRINTSVLGTRGYWLPGALLHTLRELQSWVAKIAGRRGQIACICRAAYRWLLHSRHRSLL